MAFLDLGSDITPRESVQHDWRVEEFRMQADHATDIKKLELELQREEHASELALKHQELRVASLLRLPVLLIKLPLFILFGLAYVCSTFTKKEMPKRYWDLLS